jgi:hypothetical protein
MTSSAAAAPTIIRLPALGDFRGLATSILSVLAQVPASLQRPVQGFRAFVRFDDDRPAVGSASPADARSSVNLSLSGRINVQHAGRTARRRHANGGAAQPLRRETTGSAGWPDNPFASRRLAASDSDHASGDNMPPIPKLMHRGAGGSQRGSDRACAPVTRAATRNTGVPASRQRRGVGHDRRRPGGNEQARGLVEATY